MSMAERKCKALIVGAGNGLTVSEISIPIPLSGEVLVKVEATGVNRADVHQRLGNYPPPPGASEIIGLEVAGTVVATGPEVCGFREGERVMSLVSGGGYAEYCVCPQQTTLPIPKFLSFIEAAAIPEAYFTIWSNVFDMGRLVAGETLLVHGGTSGIGSTTIQLARAFGATVVTTARNDEKCAACLNLGANHAINYAANDFAEEVKKITDGAGVDVIFDWIGADYLEKHISLLKCKGRLVLISSTSGTQGKLHLSRVIGKNLYVMGSVLRGRPLNEKAEIARAVRDHLIPLLESGKIKPLIYRTFPFTEANEAHRAMEASAHIGKIVLTPSMPN